ncbi:MAG: HAMP domain-containing histidine kinase [Archangiaceae bacterium]|nr:HAMP domain-containing histidine kinase [Archangiaceae bacterium]
MAGSIVHRVALGAALAASAAALLVALTTTVVASLVLQRAEDRRLEEAAVTFADELGKEGDGLEAIRQVLHDEAAEMGHTGMLLAVYDASGTFVSGERIVELPTSSGCATLSARALRVCRASSSNGLWAVVGGVHSQPLPLLAGSAFLAALLAAALAWAASRPLSRRVTAPLTRLRERIAELEVDALTQSRLGDDENVAEVDALRTTIAQLIARVDRALAQAQRFAGNAAHELRTPLTTIQAELELLVEGAAEPRNRESAEVVQRKVAELSVLVERLLILSVPTQSAVNAHEVVSLRDLVEDVALTLPTSERARVQVTEGDAVVRGDAVLLGTMVANGVANGLKFGDSVRVEVSQAGRHAVLRIDDDGPGVSLSERETVFEPFFRTKDALSRRIPGHGLGLALIRHVAEAHGGSAALTDPNGRGARLEIRLPLDEADPRQS